MAQDTTKKGLATKTVLSAALIASLMLNGFLFVNWQEFKLRNATLNQATLRNATLNQHLEQVAKDLRKEKTDVEATLAECNATLADVQAKAAPLCPVAPPAPAPVTCPISPAPACPAAIICPPIQPPIVCPAAPPPIACPLVPAAPQPATIATPIPTPKMIHKRPHLHRRHYSRPARFECEGEAE